MPDHRRSRAVSEETASWLKLRKAQAMIQEGVDYGDQQEDN
jgi:hypothetical protein